MKTSPTAIAAALAACAALAPLTAAAQVTTTSEPFTNELARRINGSVPLAQKFISVATGTPTTQLPPSFVLQNVALAGSVNQVDVATLVNAPVVSAASVGQFTFPNCTNLPTKGSQATTYKVGTTSTATWTDTKSLTITNTLNLQAKFPGGQVQDTLTTNYNDTQTKGTSTTNTMQQMTSAAASYWVAPGTAVRLDFTSTLYDLKDSPVTYQVKPAGTLSALMTSKTVSGKSAYSYDGTYGISTTALPGWIPMTYGSRSACAYIHDGKATLGTVNASACQIVSSGMSLFMKPYSGVWMHPALEWESSWSKDMKVPTGSPYPTWAEGLPCVDAYSNFGHTDNQAICKTPNSYMPGASGVFMQNAKNLRYRQSNLVAVPTSVLEPIDPLGLVVAVTMNITAQIAKNDITARTTEVPVDPPCAK